MSSSHQDGSASFAAQRILQLNGIELDITRLLQVASHAVKALSDHPGEGESQKISIETRKELFTQKTTEYFALLSSIDVNVRRQIYALEEAKIVRPTQKAGERDQDGQATVTSFDGSGTGRMGAVLNLNQVGKLDIGWLNSRSDKVGMQKELENWEAARDLLEKLNDSQAGGAPPDTQDTEMSSYPVSSETVKGD